MKNIKNIYQVIGIILLCIGLLFSYIIAETNDAPGFVLLGGVASIGVSTLLFGMGEFVYYIRENNKLLNEISKEIKKYKD